MAKARPSTQDDAEAFGPGPTDLDTPDPAAEGMARVVTNEQAQTGEIVIGGPALQSLMNWCVEFAQRTDEDDWAAMERSVAQILAGADAVEVLTKDTPLQGKEMCTHPGRSEKERVSVPILVHGFTLTATEYEDGWPFYANMDAEIPSTGQRRVINCGGVKVIAKLKRLDEFGEWPYLLHLVGTRTRAKNTVLDLSDPGEFVGK